MPAYEPCPFCQKQVSEKVVFTPWGGVIGPRVFSLVKCKSCGGQYNGRSGRCVAKAIRIYTYVTLAVLAFVAGWAIYAYSGDKSSPTNESSHPALRRMAS